MLAACRTVDEAKKVRDLAEAARVYAREADLGQEAMNHAAEIKLRAERRAGEVLDEMVTKGLRKSQATAKSNNAPSLDDLGIEPQDSSRWQKLAKADPADFESYIAETKEAGAPITTAGAIRYLTPNEKREREDRTQELFVIYRALEAISTFAMTPKQWARLDHGASGYRVDDHLEPAWKWLSGLRDAWQTT